MLVIFSIFNLFKRSLGKINSSYLIFYLILNFKILNCTDSPCKDNNIINLENTNCFNNIIKFEGNKYRAGRFVTTKNGELLIEYSEDSNTPGEGRLFYRLTKDSRGYYDDGNSIKKFNIGNKVSTKDEHGNNIQISGRYEARNILINLEGDTSGKEYLLSTSSWYSLTELHDLESDIHYSWSTPDFFNMNSKYIFSFQYEILNQPNTYNYFLIYVEYKELSGNYAASESFYIRKFNLKFFNESNPYKEIKVINEPQNENDRVISAFIIENKQKLCVLFLKQDTPLILRTYDYNLENSNDFEIDTLSNWVGGTGLYFKAVNLDENYIAVIYMPDGNQQNVKLKFFKYESSFSLKFERQIYISDISNGVVDKELYKVNKNRLVFAIKASNNLIYSMNIQK